MTPGGGRPARGTSAARAGHRPAARRRGRPGLTGSDRADRA